MYALPATEDNGKRKDYLVPHPTEYGYYIWNLDASALDIEGNETICSPQFGPTGKKGNGFRLKLWPNGFDEGSEGFVSISMVSTERCGKVKDHGEDIYLYKDSGFNEFLFWKVELNNVDGPIALAGRRPMVNTKDYDNQVQDGLIYGLKKFIRKSELLKMLDNGQLKIVCYARRFIRRTIFFDEKVKPESHPNDSTFEESQRAEEEMNDLRREKETKKKKMFMGEEEEVDEEDPDVDVFEAGKEGEYDKEEDDDDDEGLGSDVMDSEKESDKSESGEEKDEETAKKEEQKENMSGDEDHVEPEDVKKEEEEEQNEEMPKEEEKEDEDDSHEEEEKPEPSGEQHEEEEKPEPKKKTYEDKEWDSYKKKGDHDVLLVFSGGTIELDQDVICKHSEFFRRECEKKEQVIDGMVVIDMREWRYTMFVPVKMFMYECQWPLDENIDPGLVCLVKHLEIQELRDYIEHYLVFNLRSGYSPVMYRVAEEFEMKLLQKASGGYVNMFYKIFEKMKPFNDFVKKFYNMATDLLSDFFGDFKFW